MAMATAMASMNEAVAREELEMEKEREVGLVMKLFPYQRAELQHDSELLPRGAGDEQGRENVAATSMAQAWKGVWPTGGVASA